jgi:hypothetical protein
MQRSTSHSLRTQNPKEPNANEIAMLLANMAKDDSMQRVLALKRDIPKQLSKSAWAMDQLMDCFVKGAQGAYNKDADFDYLSYFFADLAKFPKGREYLTTPQEHDANIIPITKIQVFTDHPSHIRRLGVASTIKNVAFHVPAHPLLISNLSPDPNLPHPSIGANLLPYILLPLMGPEEYSDEDTEGMLDELQLLEPDKEREKDVEIMKTHLESENVTCMLTTKTYKRRAIALCRFLCGKKKEKKKTYQTVLEETVGRWWHWIMTRKTRTTELLTFYDF